MKFKPGDKVVYINFKSHFYGELAGKVFILHSKVGKFGNIYWNLEESEAPNSFSPVESNLVTLEIWNSPLYQQLREEDEN